MEAMREDPSAPDNTDKLLSGSEAAEFLGVKSATLYAYASRGLIESIPAKNARERCYRLSDLVKLRQSSRGFKSVKDEDDSVWTGPVIKSAITEIREDGHRYRGQSALDLARAGTPFELVAELIWQTDNRDQKLWRRIKPLSVPSPARKIASPDIDSLDLLKLVLSSLEIVDPVHRKLLSDDHFDTARRLIVTIALALGWRTRREKYFASSNFAVAESILFALTRNRAKERVRLVNSALVLCADHELNASAFAARVAASCDASLYSSLLAALGTFSGTLHGSASRKVEDIVSSSMRFKSAGAWLKDALKQYGKIPGFGSDIYSAADPRADYLIAEAKMVSPRNAHLKRLCEIVDCVRDHLGVPPNVDLGLAAMSYALSLPAGAGSAIFAVSRTAGWIGHAVEQRLYGGVIRPRARYIGKSEVE